MPIATIAQVEGSGTWVAINIGLSKPVPNTEALPLGVNFSIVPPV